VTDNMSAEPWQLHNLAVSTCRWKTRNSRGSVQHKNVSDRLPLVCQQHTLSETAVGAMVGQLKALMDCKGQGQCYAAGQPLGGM